MQSHTREHQPITNINPIKRLETYEYQPITNINRIETLETYGNDHVKRGTSCLTQFQINE